MMKGIILAGGLGTRLSPMTNIISKHLLPIHDKPMIYYSLSTLMLAKIKNVLIISTERDIPLFQLLLGDGSKFGMHIEYKVQEKPEGLAQSFIIGEDFIEKDNCALILGDNLFFGNELVSILSKNKKNNIGATIFAYPVKDPQRYGVVEVEENHISSIEEKPVKPKSNLAITGLYFYNNSVIEIAKKIKPSDRGELEITDLNRKYLEKDQLNVEIMGRGMTWFDAGTVDSMMDASQFVNVIEKRQGLKIACPEEIAWRNKWITKERMLIIIDEMQNIEYKNYLIGVLQST
tara:strand:- start:93 stop:962 length:870 start_codon:yes stop_codon:yes gene_type:complete